MLHRLQLFKKLIVDIRFPVVHLQQHFLYFAQLFKFHNDQLVWHQAAGLPALQSNSFSAKQSFKSGPDPVLCASKIKIPSCSIQGHWFLLSWLPTTGRSF
jgi:hypothetical protein